MTTPPLDETAFAGPEHLDPAYVAGYDRKAGPEPAQDAAELGLGPASTLIDIGAGTGALALAAAPLCERVVAVDVSPAMVAAMRVKAVEQGATNVECVEAGFITYEHTGDSADIVYTRNALHHLPDFWKAIALRRIADMLAPDGVLRLRDLVFAFPSRDADRFIERWLDSATLSIETGWTREELEVHLRDEHSTFTWLLEPLIEQAGFEIVRADYGDLRVYADYTCRKRVLG